jgi:hypothetical protein
MGVAGNERAVVILRLVVGHVYILSRFMLLVKDR